MLELICGMAFLVGYCVILGSCWEAPASLWPESSVVLLMANGPNSPADFPSTEFESVSDSHRFQFVCICPCEFHAVPVLVRIQDSFLNR